MNKFWTRFWKSVELGLWVFAAIFLITVVKNAFKPDPIAQYVKSERSANDADCDDFDTQIEAQTYWQENEGYIEDVDHLDRDGNGIVCESLP